MKLMTNARNVDGKQQGSIRPTNQIITAILLSLIIGFLPQGAFAASPYSKTDTEIYLKKISDSYGQMIDIAALLHDYDAKMIMAVIVVESEGNPVALSHKGARGLMQLMPQTAAAMGAKDSNDPFQNILAGTKYLKQLENRYGFSDTRDALVAYNMGPSRAKRWLSQYDSSNYGYVKKVSHVYNILEQKEIDQKRMALSIEKKIDESERIQNLARRIMTKPQNVQLASLPVSLANSRRSEIATEN